MANNFITNQYKIIIGLHDEINNLHTRLFKIQAISAVLIVGLSIAVIYLMMSK
jgi:hypothetical protein